MTLEEQLAELEKRLVSCTEQVRDLNRLMKAERRSQLERKVALRLPIDEVLNGQQMVQGDKVP